MERVTRAISIRQPYVELILQGRKTIEYRTTPTNIRERVYLYAALSPADDDEAWEEVGAQPHELTRGLIVGTVEIVHCRASPEFEDCYEYLLVNPERLTAPLKAMNQPQPKFWKPRFA